MILEFIAAIAIAFGAGGVVLMINRLTRGSLPGWLIPAAAGASMILFMVYMEYSWEGRVTQSLPEGVVVASTNEVRSWYRPWTYVFPLSNRMRAVDTRLSRTNAAHPDMVMTAVVMIARWEPMRQFGAVFDCAGNRRADLLDQVRFDEDGGLGGATWIELPPDEPVLRIVCDGV